GLAVVLGLRLALSPFTAAVGQPAALWRPRGVGLLFASPPAIGLVVALQVVGVAAAALHLWRRRLPPLVVAWACLLALAALRTSLGKILHNDVLLVLAAIPLLLAGRRPDEGEARTGLDAAAAIVLLSYLSAGWWKLLRSGPAWAWSDNLRWSLAAGRGGAGWPGLADRLVTWPVVCTGLAGAILALELGSALVWVRPRLAPCFVGAAAAMHVGTWLVLGLDYFAHLAVVALVLLPWARMRSMGDHRGGTAMSTGGRLSPGRGERPGSSGAGGAARRVPAWTRPEGAG
ncbi:MAG: hypothetical protein ABIS47_13575, partial [Acidimicrobiales bacterium]